MQPGPTELVIIGFIGIAVVVAVMIVRRRIRGTLMSTPHAESTIPAPTAAATPTDPFTERQRLIDEGDYVKGAANIVVSSVRDPFAAHTPPASR